MRQYFIIRITQTPLNNDHYFTQKTYTLYLHIQLFNLLKTYKNVLIMTIEFYTNDFNKTFTALQH